MIVSQSRDDMIDFYSTLTIKKDVRKRNCQGQDDETNAVYDLLTPELKRCAISLKGEALHHGILFSHLKNMDSTYTRKSLGM